jgi:phage gp46-like protein
VTDIRLKEYYTLAGVTMDWLLLDIGMLDERDELATAVRVALGSDALASADDILPDPDSTDRRGWWGDMDANEIWQGWEVGCRNWLLTRAKITDSNSFEGSTTERARQYTLSALQPFIDQRIASQVDVTATRTDTQEIDVSVTIYRGPEAEIDLRYQLAWQEPVPLDVPPAPVLVPIIINVPAYHMSLTTTPAVRTSSILYPPSGNLALTRTPPSLTQVIRGPLQGNVALSPTAPTVVRTASTWSTTDISSGITLSNANLTATSGSTADKGVRSTTSRSTGKYYVEFTNTSWAGADTGAGIATSSATLAAIGLAGAGGFVTFTSGAIYFNGSNTGINTGFSNSATTVCMAVDLGNMRGWFRTANNNWNNSGTANPATNTGGIDISALFATNPAFLLFCSNGSGANATINLGGSAFTYTAPAGFTAWG